MRLRSATNIDRAAEEVLQFVLEPAEIEEAVPWLCVYQEVHVALFVCITARHRAEDVHNTRSVLGADA